MWREPDAVAAGAQLDASPHRAPRHLPTADKRDGCYVLNGSKMWISERQMNSNGLAGKRRAVALPLAAAAVPSKRLR